MENKWRKFKSFVLCWWKFANFAYYAHFGQSGKGWNTAYKINVSLIQDWTQNAKTQFMTNLVLNRNILLENSEIIQVTLYKYLSHEIRIDRENQTCEIGRRI